MVSSEKEMRIERMQSGDFQMSNRLATHLSQMTTWMKNNFPGEFITSIRLVIRIMLPYIPDANLANVMQWTWTALSLRVFSLWLKALVFPLKSYVWSVYISFYGITNLR
jgi:hypothetical protein